MRTLTTPLLFTGIAFLVPCVALAQAPAAPAADTSAAGNLSFDTSAGSEADANAGASAAAPMAAAPSAPRNYGGPVSDEDDTWGFSYSGYFRAPMRVGIGKRSNKNFVATGGVDTTADPRGNPVTDENLTAASSNWGGSRSDTTLHNPVVPDDQYLSWQHTRHNQRDWAELFFTYGNSWAKGTVALQGFNFTDAGYNDTDAQFGVSQAWVEVTPYMPWENIRLSVKGGSFWNRYGMAGKYDAGEYDTFLFGRTHAVGETARLEIDFDDITLGLEQGIGTKQPDPSIYNTTRFTMLHHEHVDVAINGPVMMEFGGHFLYSWTQSENMEVNPVGSMLGKVNLGDGFPDGSLAVFGGDARFDFGRWGYLYGGFSRVQAEYSLTVAPAIEVIHSYGGGAFDIGVTGNYLDGFECLQATGDIAPNSTPPVSCSLGSGNINTVMAQYEASATSLAEASLFGEGRELTMKVYGMVNMVEVPDVDDAPNDGLTKMKLGVDALFDVAPVLGVGLRFDHLKPNSEFSSQDFSIVSPRIVFRSQLVTHEEISLQYSRYLYSQRTCAAGTPADIAREFNSGPDLNEQLCVQPPTGAVTPSGFGATTENQDPGNRAAPTYVPDENVIKISASMWW